MNLTFDKCALNVIPVPNSTHYTNFDTTMVSKQKPKWIGIGLKLDEGRLVPVGTDRSNPGSTWEDASSAPSCIRCTMGQAQAGRKPGLDGFAWELLPSFHLRLLRGIAMRCAFQPLQHLWCFIILRGAGPGGAPTAIGHRGSRPSWGLGSSAESPGEVMNLPKEHKWEKTLKIKTWLAMHSPFYFATTNTKGSKDLYTLFDKCLTEHKGNTQMQKRSYVWETAAQKSKAHLPEQEILCDISHLMFCI